MVEWALKLDTAPAKEPFDLTTDLAQVKTRIRVDSSEEDALIQRHIKTARRRAENYLGRALITQTWKFFLYEFPSGDTIWLPKPPLKTFTHIKYTDTDGTTTTLDSGEYHASTNHEPALVRLAWGKTWPTVTLKTLDPIELAFNAGYGDDGSSVPDDILDGMLLDIGYLYENRG